MSTLFTISKFSLLASYACIIILFSLHVTSGLDYCTGGIIRYGASNECSGTIISGGNVTIRIINHSSVSIYPSCNNSISGIPTAIPDNQNATFYGDIYGRVTFKIGNETILGFDNGSYPKFQLDICWDRTVKSYNFDVSGNITLYKLVYNSPSCQNGDAIEFEVYKNNSTPTLTQIPKDPSCKSSNSFHFSRPILGQAVAIALGALFGIVVLSE